MTLVDARDLELVTALLLAASQTHASESLRTLRGRISHIVVDTWSFDAPLSDDIVAFDDRFIVP